MSLRAFGNRLATGINKNADIIMTICAIGGLVTTVALAIKAAPKGNDILYDTRRDISRIKEQAKAEDWDEEEEKEELLNVRLCCARDLVINYIPTAVSFVGTAALIIGSNRINRKRNAALTGMLNATTLAYQEYRDHMKEEIGEKKFAQIDDNFERKRMEKRPVLLNTDEVIHTGKGDKLYSIDTVPGDIKSRIFFRSCPEAVNKAELDFNSFMLFSGGDNEGVYADYLYFLGIPDAVKYHGAMMTFHKMSGPQDFVHPRYLEYIHPVLNENWCHIDWYPDDWEFAGYERYS